MPTDEERCEVAARLRWLTMAYKDVFGVYVLNAIGLDFTNRRGTYCSNDSVRRLADLIEPEERTCRMVLDEDATSLLEYDDVFRCTACGEEVVRKTGTTVRFCPMCGARVTDWVVPG